MYIVLHNTVYLSRYHLIIKAARLSGLTLRVMISLHYVLFDGSSSYVGSSDDITSETEVVFKNKDFDKCSDFCDNYNDSL